MTRSLSWLFIFIGLLLAGYGGYNYYLSQLAQDEAAQEWNTATTEEPVPQALPQPQTQDKTAKRVPYFDPYKPGETVAKLILPRSQTPLFVVEGTDQKELKRGPGHMPGTALPGVDGNCVIAGHRDTHFRPLESVREGDQVELETKYGTFRYRIRSMEVVSPTNVASLLPTDDAVLHLITCYPFRYVGHAPKRMVIEAELLRNQETASRGQ